VGTLTTVHRRHWGPWWLWTIVVLLAGSGAYAGLWARDATEKLAQAEAARALLAANRQELQSDRQGLERQLESARAAEAKLKADLDRVRAEGDAVSVIVGKQEKRIAGLEADLKAATEMLSAQKADAMAVSADAVRLQEEVTALTSERDAAKAEAARAAEAKAALEREIAGLKDEVGKLQAKLAPDMTGATSAPVP
jgi:chromosome segregation ATPase